MSSMGYAATEATTTAYPTHPRSNSSSSAFDFGEAAQGRTRARPPSFHLASNVSHDRASSFVHPRSPLYALSPWSRASFGPDEIGPFVDRRPSSPPFGFRNFAGGTASSQGTSHLLPPMPHQPSVLNLQVYQQHALTPARRPSTVRPAELFVPPAPRWLGRLADWPWTRQTPGEAVAYQPLIDGDDLRTAAYEVNELQLGTQAWSDGAYSLHLSDVPPFERWLAERGLGPLNVPHIADLPRPVGPRKPAPSAGLPTPASSPRKARGRPRNNPAKRLKVGDAASSMAFSQWPTPPPSTGQPSPHLGGPNEGGPISRWRDAPAALANSRAAAPTKVLNERLQVRASLLQLPWRTLASQESYALLPDDACLHQQVIDAAVQAWCDDVADPVRLRGPQGVTLLVLKDLFRLTPWLAEVGLPPIAAPTAQGDDVAFLHWFAGGTADVIPGAPAPWRVMAPPYLLSY